MQDLESHDRRRSLSLARIAMRELDNFWESLCRGMEAVSKVTQLFRRLRARLLADWCKRRGSQRIPVSRSQMILVCGAGF
jgi:hypothetical protein